METQEENISVLLFRNFDEDTLVWRNKKTCLFVCLMIFINARTYSLCLMIFFMTWIIFDSSTFQYVDDQGFDWGAKVQKKAGQIQTLLLGKEELREARLKALKITSQINGFGNSTSFSPPSSSNSNSPRRSSRSTPTKRNDPVTESDTLILDENKVAEKYRTGEETMINGICSKLAGLSSLKKFHGGHITAAKFQVLSNVERVCSKCNGRRNSIGY